MEKEASQLKRDHVHSVYEKIAPYVNDTRYKAWSKVQQFISEQEPGSLIVVIVIRYFSMEERHMRAIKEVARILRVGGQIMIYVWAMEQKQRRFEKQDVFVPWNPHLLPAPRVSLAHMEDKNQFFTRTKSWL